MKKFLLYLALVVIVALPLLVTPVSAGEEKKLKIGDKLVIGEGAVTEFLGKTPDGQFQFRAVFGAPQYLADLQTTIKPQWLYDSDKGEFYADDNLFEARVKKDKVWVEKDGQKENWKPTIQVGSMNYKYEAEAVLLPVDPINSNYTNNTLMWDYGIAKRYLRIIEGMLIEYYTFDYDPYADIRIKSNLYKDENFVWNRLPYAYDAEGKPIAISADKVILASELGRDDITYPITIDPSTTFTTSSSDGHLFDSDTDYEEAHDSATGGVNDSAVIAYTGQTLTGRPAVYVIWRTALFFDTSAFPSGANITSGTLKLYGASDESTTDFNVQIQIGSGTPPTYPHDPLVGGDYLYTQYSDNGGAFNTSSFNDAGYNSITLSVDGKSWINKDGTTKFMLLSDEDIGDSAPTGWEMVSIHSYEKGIGYRPELVVTYVASTLPTITADAATYIGMTTARLNSTLTDDGGESCNVSFQYNTTDNFTNGGTTNTTWVAGFNIGSHPYVDITSLAPNTLHYFRVRARNEVGTANSTSLSFTTVAEVGAPANFKAFPEADRIPLSWTKGSGATNTLIRYKEGTYPTGISDGDLVYSGGLGTYAHNTDLFPGHSYYYSAWGFSGDNYSASYATVMATTLASPIAADDPVTVPDLHPTWFGTPDYTKFSGLPIYHWMNEAADAQGMPRNSYWFLGAIFACLSFGVVVFVTSRNGQATMVAIVVTMAVGALIELLPMFMMGFALLVLLGLGYIRRRA